MFNHDGWGMESLVDPYHVTKDSALTPQELEARQLQTHKRPIPQKH
jgi:hypothetical protein